VATGIVWAWVITMPFAGLLAAGFYLLARFADRMGG
jgi:phosphate/sulfate permease